ncbi:MAG: L-2-hydroxyglutarate oxidase [Paraglaciecola sp.]|jgi:L-2-hydroxyglutarate oxidase
MAKYDVVIIGAGILGAATAWQLLLQYPHKRVLLVEKEPFSATHQTGRNSGVIHAGVYYQPGSLKAQYCRQGLQETIAFCQQHGLPFRQCGKLLVATNTLELERMHSLYLRCQLNQLEPQFLSQKQLKHLEPNIHGIGAIKVSESGIVDYASVTRTMLSEFERLGGKVAYGQTVTGLKEQAGGVHIKTTTLSLTCQQLISCAGLMSDRMIKLQGLTTDFQIIAFRGEYFQLAKRLQHVVQHLVYPIPDPALPFLGVHLTPMISGEITVGPNAVLALARENYSKLAINPRDLADMLGFGGFWSLLHKQRGSALVELKNSLFKGQYLALVQKYCPDIGKSDLLPHPTGIRAQAVSNQGELIHDFKFVQTAHSLHVANAPSPAATSAIPIAKHIIDKVRAELN